MYSLFRIVLKRVKGMSYSLSQSEDHLTPLGDMLGKGDQASIFRLRNRPELCAKIYHDPLNEEKKAQISYLIARPEVVKNIQSSSIALEELCWPLKEIYKEGEMVGYVMPTALAMSELTSLFDPQLRSFSFPSWTRLEVCQMTIKLLTLIDHLHQAEIYLGPHSSEHILLNVRKPEQVSLMSLDRCIFKGEMFTHLVDDLYAPFRLKKAKKQRNTQKWTDRDEGYAIADLLFKIFMQGQPPFGDEEGNTVLKDLKNQEFLYPMGDFDTEGKSNLFQHLWNLMSYRLRVAFFECFSQNQVLKCSDWIEILETEIHAIQEGQVLPFLDASAFNEASERPGVLDDGRRKGKGNALNLMYETEVCKRIGVLELSTRAVKALKVSVSDVWQGFKWGAPAFENRAVLTHTGQYLDKDKNLNLRAFKSKVLKEIKFLKRWLIDLEVDRIYVIATAVYRSAANRDEILKLIQDEAGLSVQILDRDQEGLATFKGYEWISRGNQAFEFESDLMLIDQGGGSTEIAYFSPQGQRLAKGHIPLGTEAGVNALFNNTAGEALVEHALDTALSFMKRRLSENTQDLVNYLEKRNRPFQIIGVGSAITSATRKKKNRSQHGVVLTQEKLSDFMEHARALVESGPYDTVKQLDEVARRSVGKTIIYYESLVHYLGISMLSHLLDRFQHHEVTVSGVGLRYGFVYQQLCSLYPNFGQGLLPEELKPEQVVYEGLEVGQYHHAPISSRRDFGVFVDLGPVDGLLHVSEIEKIGYTLDPFEPGVYIPVEILSIQVRPKVKISLKLTPLRRQ